MGRVFEGTVVQGSRAPPGEKAVKLKWADTLATHIVPIYLQPAGVNGFARAKAVVLCCGDVVHSGSYVIV